MKLYLLYFAMFLMFLGAAGVIVAILEISVSKLKKVHKWLYSVLLFIVAAALMAGFSYTLQLIVHNTRALFTI